MGGDCFKRGPIGGGLQTQATVPKGKKLYTNVICAGCGCDEKLCDPLGALELRCCCLEVACRVDPSTCSTLDGFCAGRLGCRLGPAAMDLKNPIVDNHELVVICEKPLIECK